MEGPETFPKKMVSRLMVPTIESWLDRYVVKMNVNDLKLVC